MGVAAGSYEPGLASVMTPTRSIVATNHFLSGEPTTKEQQPTVFCRRNIRFKTLSTGEGFVQLKVSSSTFLTIWMRKDKKTEAITTDMWIVYRGVRYSIQGRYYLEYIQDEVGFRVITG